MMTCPYCEQDTVWRVKLVSSADCEFSMCFECDSVWATTEPISDETGATFENYMASLGQPVDWSNVERIAMVE